MAASKNSPDELRAQLRAKGTRLPEPLQRLGDALWNEPDAVITHEVCRAALPQLIEAELSGENVAETFASVKQHLDGCDSCATEYAELLDTARAAQRGALVSAQNIPRPDLAFLSKHPPARSMPETVLEWARGVLAAHAPTHTRELDVIAETFFERVKQLGAFELRAGTAQAMGLDRRDPSPALATLAATHAATQALISEMTHAQFDAWIQQGTLRQELETHAAKAARDIGLAQEAASDFARAFAEQVVNDPTPLETLLREV